jgi:PAS domain S-box-containing protein
MAIVLGLTLPQWAAIFTIIVTVLGLLKPIRQKLIEKWTKLFGKTRIQLNRIEAELRPNGGGSLRDAIDSIINTQSMFAGFMVASLNIHQDAVFRADVDGKVTFTNRAHQRLTGFSLGESLGDGWVNYLAPYERERLQRIWHECILTGRELNEDIMFIKHDRTEYPVRAHVYREMTGDTITGWLGVIYPLGERNVENCGKESCPQDLWTFPTMEKETETKPEQGR